MKLRDGLTMAQAMRDVRVCRAGLRESLEAYAARTYRNTAEARDDWRRESLRLLGAEDCETVDVRSGLCRVAPVTVYTSNGPAETDEDGGPDFVCSIVEVGEWERFP